MHRAWGTEKVGNFTVSFTDLQVPVGTLPITLTRTYDSRDKRVGDFGVGWTLGISNVRVEKTHVLGKYWTQTSTGGWVPSYCLEPTKAALVTITLPHRKVFKFRTGVEPGCQQYYPLEMVDLAFTPEPGTYGTLEALDVPAVIVQHSEGPTDLVDLDLNPVDSRRFRLTTDDSTVFVLSQDRGIETITDRNGNSLTISAAGVIHSSGKSVSFTRDVLGRITLITDPAGQTLTYEYNPAGDLTAVTDRTAARTTFGYNARHDLLDIFDPRGVRPVRNEYDASGRLLRHIDPYGKVIEYTHDIGARQELITDRLGGARLLEYDYRGNVVRETDPEGKVTTRTFDARDNRTSESDPEGRTTTWVWDAIDNLISTTDALGHTSSTSYNAKRQVLTQTDARGGVTTNDYDLKGNLTTTTDALGKTTTCTYDGAGNQLTETNALGHVTRYDVDGHGNRTKQTDALGKETTFTFDANGNQLTSTRTRTTPSGTVTETTATEYDGNSRVTKVTAADGSITRTVYNSLGKPDHKIDALGRTTAYVYDSLGRLTTTTYPDGTTEAATYDFEGRRLTSTDRGGRTTGYEVDGLGRLKKTTYVDGAFTTSTYDDSGKLIASTDARGKSTTYEYDGAGRQTKVTDPLGNETVSGYDAVGNRTSVRDARLQTTTYVFDLGGRLTRTVFPDTTERSSTYDDLGRRISDTDQAGRVTQFGYDALGRLTSVTDAAGGVTAYGYDEAGNRTSQTDAEGRTTTFGFDALGREVSRTLPDGSSEQKGYDAAGNQTSRTDFAGRTTTYAFDAADRLVTRTYPDTTAVSFTYTATGRRLTATDARGATVYGYNSRDRLTSLTYPDGRALEYGWDNAGNRTSLTAVLGTTRITSSLSYDDAGRLDTVTDPNGQGYGHTYDANGNRASLTYPNGVTTAYSFDANNRLATLTTANGGGTTLQSYAFTLGPTGNRTRIDEGDGTVRGYCYDSLYRLTRETNSGGAFPAYEKQFGYDRVGNRLSQVTTGAGAASVAYAYDTRDRLQTENSLAYSFDVNGNLVGEDGQATYVWDFDNRLIEVHLASGALVEHRYDVDGTRVRTKLTPPTGPPTETNHLVDTAGALSHVVAETDAAGVLGALYVRGDDLLSIHRPGQVRYVHADGLGSIRRLTDESGAVTDRYTYTAFGELLDHTGSDPQPYQFAGEPYDPNSGFYYNRARWLDPRVGRFLTTDPWRGNASNAKSLHRYAYAGGNPIGSRDPTGLFTMTEALVTVAALAVGAGLAYGSYALTMAAIPFWARYKGLHIDLHAIAIRKGYYDPNKARENWIAALREDRKRYIDIEYGDLPSLVEQILENVGPLKLRSLVLVAHGNESGPIIGTSDVNLDQFRDYEGEFARLARVFEPDGFLFLEACNVGRNRDLVRKIADAVGVKVFANKGMNDEYPPGRKVGLELCYPHSYCYGDAGNDAPPEMLPWVN
jgi:RHS repeat-associated protein